MIGRLAPIRKDAEREMAAFNGTPQASGTTLIT
jgi:hypothetical protein